jgi:hypothetical protein
MTIQQTIYGSGTKFTQVIIQQTISITGAKSTYSTVISLPHYCTPFIHLAPAIEMKPAHEQMAPGLQVTNQ